MSQPILNEVTMKNGQLMILRRPEAEDAEQLLKYLNRVGGESDNLLFGKNGFAHMTVEQEKKHIENMNRTPNTLMMLGVIGGEIVSISQICGKTAPRIAHNFELSITVSRNCWNIGVGTAAMTEMIHFAKEHGAKCVHLGVKANNTLAIRLYEKFGFSKIGVHKDFFNVGGVFYDELLMDLYL